MSNRTIAKLSPVVSALIKAKETINTPEKWHKGHFKAPDREAYCAAGALRVVLGIPLHPAIPIPFHSTYHQAATCLSRCAPIEHDGITFNDNATTTHKDIIEWFNDAIDYAIREKANV